MVLPREREEKEMTKEQTIKNYMDKLHISYEEAEQLFLDDENDVSVELTADQKKAVKEMTQADRKKETTPRKRERKPDEEKRFLIAVFVDCLMNGYVDGIEEILVKNIEREIEFTYKGNTYRLTLMKPRKEKE
jgi:hypothetical protein